MAHINNFTDMINALPKQEMEVTEDLESPVSPPVSTPTSEPPLIIDRLSTPNGITSISSGEIILPKRSPVADLLKNGPLSAAVCGNSSQRGDILFPRSAPILPSQITSVSNSVPQYVQNLITPSVGSIHSRQVSSSPMNKPGTRYPSALVKIVEQPAENRVRFRFPIEGRSAGSIAGVTSTTENKTFPTIEIVGYKGPAKVVVSCVEDKFFTELNGYKTYRSHPHNLVGKHCKEGVCIMDINEETMACQFSNIGVQCVTKRQIEASLQIRKRIQVDPFGLGFDHKNSDRTTVRLCFQVFLKPKEGGLVPLLPVVSSLIKDKRAHPDLNIVDISDDSSPVEGGKKILLFCSKIKKEDIEVLFLHYGKNGEEIRTTKGEFGESNVHDQSGISFRTPPYPDPDITEPVKVSICLRQPTKNVQSEPQDFWYTPSSSKIEARNATLDNDLKQKILMIQRIAEEAKLPDFDIKKEEKLSPKIPASSRKGSFTPPSQIGVRNSEFSKSENINSTSKQMSNKLKAILKSPKNVTNLPNEDDSKSQSRFPLTGSYGGIISVNNERSMEHEHRPRSMPGSDSGFIDQPSRSVILRHNTPDTDIRNQRPGFSNFLQQEKHLANCVRLIAADMEEFEKEPENSVDSHQPPNTVPFINLNSHTTMIPNSEIFKGTCADDAFGLNLAPSVKFPSQPLDLSTLSSSAASVSPEPSKSSASQERTIQSTQDKGKRKRVRKQTEPHPINIIPMTPMPHMSKDDEGFMEKDPSIDSGIMLSSVGTEKILVAPKKRKRTYKQKNSDASFQGPVISGSIEERPKTTSPPSLIPIHSTKCSSPVLSMPLIGEIENPGKASSTNWEPFSIKQEVSDNEDRELGLVIDTDGEED